MRKVLSAILILMFATISYAQQSEIDQVKSTEIDGYPYTNTGKAFEEFFVKPKWKVITDNRGVKTVVFKGIFDENPYDKYSKSNTYEHLSDEKYTAMVKTLYDVAYDYNLRKDDLYGSDATKSKQILYYLSSRVYKQDSAIEVYFRMLPDGQSWWVKDYICETCPTKDVNDLYALVMDGRFVGSIDPIGTYIPVAVSAPTPAPMATPAPAVAPRPDIPQVEPTVESIPDQKIGTTTKIGQFISIEDGIAYFDIGKGEQEFFISPRTVAKVQALTVGKLSSITYDTVERYVDGAKTTIYIITDVK